MPQPGLYQPDSRFEALAESAPDAIITIDADSTILSANPATERIFGYASGELIGRSLLMLMPERLRAAHNAGIARYLATGRRNIPWTGVQLAGLTRDGREIPLEISFGEFTEESGRHVFSGFVRDISERVEAERALVEARAEADRALRELTMLGRITDAALAQVTYDEMLAELLRRIRQELEVDEATVLLLDVDQQRLAVHATEGILGDSERTRGIPMGRGIAGTVAATREPLIVDDLAEHEVVRGTLREHLTSLAAVPVWSGGEVIGVLHVGTRERHRFTDADLRVLRVVADRMAGVFARTRLFESERRARAEAEAARQALAVTERELRRLNAELEEHAREAREAVRTRDEVLSIVSHDLRNPVSTIAMSASLLLDPEIELDEKRQRTQLEVISRSARRANRLIRDLLDVARIEGGRLRLNCHCEDPAALLTEVHQSFVPMAAEKSQTLECAVHDTPRAVHVDRDRIVQVLSNYVNNALKFTPEGGRIMLRASGSEEGGVVFAVSDTGPGIAPDELPNTFTRFWQSRRTAHLGSGLGLAIARGIAEAHHGRVWVESTLGEGSTFYLALPPSAECG